MRVSLWTCLDALYEGPRSSTLSANVNWFIVINYFYIQFYFSKGFNQKPTYLVEIYYAIILMKILTIHIQTQKFIVCIFYPFQNNIYITLRS